MKKFVLSLIVCLTTVWANADVIHEEIFDYNVGTLEEATSWTITGTIEKGNGRSFDATPLTYEADGKTYILSGVGKKIINHFESGSNYIAYKSIPTVNSGDVYLSFLYKVTEGQGQSNSEIIGISNQISNSAVKPWAGKTASNSRDPFRLGVTRNSTTSAEIQWGDYELEVGKVYLIIVKYNFETETASLFINPQLGSSSEPQPVVYDDSKSTPRSELKYLMFKHNGSSIAKFEAGGIRISTTWQEAVAERLNLSSLPAPTINNPDNIQAESFIANWNNIENAIGYEVNLYQNAVYQKTYFTETATNITISGLVPENTYTYTVTAKGDGANYSDSEESTPSAPVTTTSAPSYITTDFDDKSWGEIAEENPTSGEYPTDYYINNFYFSNAIIRKGGIDCTEGDRHINRIAIDKSSNDGYINTPFIDSPKELELHISSGSDDKQFIIKQSEDGVNWTTLKTYTNDKAGVEYIYRVTIENNTTSKFRIENATSSTLYVFKVTLSNTSSLATPIAKAACGIASTEFIANWEQVTDATGYKIYLYQNEDPVDNYTISDPAITQQLLEGLQEDTEYSYQITAFNGEIESQTSNSITVTTNSTIWSRDFYTDGGWETICLPYNVNKITDANGNSISEYRLKEFTGVTFTQEEAKIIFNNTSTFEGGKPYILSMPEGTDVQIRGYIHLDKTAMKETLSITREGYSLTGTYEGIPAGQAEDKFVLNGDGSAFVRGINTTEVREYGAYFMIPSGTDNRRLIIQFGDDTTQINNQHTEGFNVYAIDKTIIIKSSIAQTVTIYDIAGRIAKVVELSEGENQIEGLAQGLYIINTNKVILK